MSLQYKYNPDGTKAYAKKLWRYKRVMQASDLREGMILIDKYACKRTVLSVSETHIWLSHKFGIRSKVTGKEWPLETFLANFPNWIFKEE